MIQKRKTATLESLAKALNLSSMAISKALRDEPDIGEETKELVRREAKKQKYKPNRAAQALRRFGK